MKSQNNNFQKYSVNDKLKYYRGLEKRNAFQHGYIRGSNMYGEYSKLDKKQKAEQKKELDYYSDRAKNGKSGDGTDYCKGVMCAMRDCANERKSRYINPF